MELERRFVTLENLSEAVDLIQDIWDNQDSILIHPYEENKISYISICDDVNDSYHGQGLLIKAKNYASIYDFIPKIIEEFKSMIKDANYLSDNSLEKAEVRDRCGKIIKKLNELYSF